jgi:hypothetical protein
VGVTAPSEEEDDGVAASIVELEGAPPSVLGLATAPSPISSPWVMSAPEHAARTRHEKRTSMCFIRRSFSNPHAAPYYPPIRGILAVISEESSERARA